MQTLTLTLTQKVEAEKRAIKLVMLGDIIMAVLGFSFYSMTQSQAILMDAVYPLIDLIAALLTLRVVALLTKQATQSQPFGYAIFEPLLNFIKGILILMVILVAFYAAVHALLTGGRYIEAEIAVLLHRSVYCGFCIFLWTQPPQSSSPVFFN